MAEGLKLSELLPDRLDRLGEETRKELCEDENVSGMRLAWGYIASQLDGAIREALDFDIFELLAKGWAAGKLLVEYADPAKHPPGQREVLKVGEYSFDRDLHPTVDVTLASQRCAELKFTLTLTGHFSGLHLTIMNGHILSCGSGDAWASAQLSYKGVPLHAEKETKKAALPGHFNFTAPGIPIPKMA
ncbi:MAG TPA: hypothetical protein VMN38_08595 [Sphingomicrobium sp.]|nr:hypothetical protein [Sphingomicrobium sp.]